MTSLLKPVFYIIPVLLLVSLAGCATVTKHPGSLPGEKTPLSKPKGIYHKVSKGETLWRIAKTYQVSVDEITLANNIPNVASIEQDQLLLIPGADVVQKISLPTTTALDNNAEFIWPVEGRVISYFGDRKGGAHNKGIDIKVGEDNVIKAARGGRVVLADRLSGYGYAVILDHSDGIFSVYGHNERLLVKLGDYVQKGAKIAQAFGKSGQVYEHFEIRKGNRAENPLHYLP